jgi:hypothetical protein
MPDSENRHVAAIPLGWQLQPPTLEKLELLNPDETDELELELLIPQFERQVFWSGKGPPSNIQPELIRAFN